MQHCTAVQKSIRSNRTQASTHKIHVCKAAHIVAALPQRIAARLAFGPCRPPARQRTHHGVREGLAARQRAAPRAARERVMLRQLLVEPRAIKYPFVEVAFVCA